MHRSLVSLLWVVQAEHVHSARSRLPSLRSAMVGTVDCCLKKAACHDRLTIGWIVLLAALVASLVWMPLRRPVT